jgi:hypothetical protein
MSLWASCLEQHRGSDLTAKHGPAKGQRHVCRREDPAVFETSTGDGEVPLSTAFCRVRTRASGRPTLLSSLKTGS